METNNDILLTIDVGSTKICAIISEIKGVDERGNPIPRMIGVGTQDSLGIKKGAVTNIEHASKTIREAVKDAERIAGKNVSEAVVSMSGAYVSSVESHGIINVPDREISLNEIKRVMSTAVYNGRIHDTYEILHVLPFSFKVDDQEGVEDPLGMNASRLEVRVNTITVQKTQINNMKRAVESAQLKVKNFVLDSYASLIATVTEDEKNHGICVIDLGGETSSFVIYASGNSVRYTNYLPFGSDNVTKDISLVCHTPHDIAEKLKIGFGSLNNNFAPNQGIEIPHAGDNTSSQTVPCIKIVEIVKERVSEVFALLRESVQESKFYPYLGSGFVLTGGFTQLDGIKGVAQQIFDVPVRIASPKKIDGIFSTLEMPSYSTAIGLILYSTGHASLYEFDSSQNMHYPSQKENNMSRPISLENISPQSFNQPVNHLPPATQTVYPPNVNQPIHNSPMENNFQNNPNPIPVSQPIMQNNPMPQPIENELPAKDVFPQDLHSSQSNRSRYNETGTATKLWQWFTQLF